MISSGSITNLLIKKINAWVNLSAYNFQKPYRMYHYKLHIWYEAFRFRFLLPTMHPSVSLEYGKWIYSLTRYLWEVWKNCWITDFIILWIFMRNGGGNYSNLLLKSRQWSIISLHFSPERGLPRYIDGIQEHYFPSLNIELRRV